MKKIIALLMLSLLILSACGGGDTLTVGTQTYSETKTMGYMYKELIEANTDLSVDVRTDMATDTLVLEAMMADELEIATTYTGTALTSFFSIDNPRDPEATMEQTQREFAEEHNIKVFDTLGFANTYALAVTQEFAEEHDVHSISNLEAMADDLHFGSDTSWLERSGGDGYEAFVELYGFEFGDASPMSPNLVYEALQNGDMDVVLAYSTDARIDVYDLQTLEDDLQFFPPYDAATFVKQEALDEHDGLEEIFNQLVGAIDLDTIRELNTKVDVDGEDPHDVAIEYLEEQGLLN